MDTLKPWWKGLVYSLSFFVVIVIQSFSFHALMHQTMSLGVRMRAALISAVFKKVFCRVEFYMKNVLQIFYHDSNKIYFVAITRNLASMLEFFYCMKVFISFLARILSWTLMDNGQNWCSLFCFTALLVSDLCIIHIYMS